MLAIANVDSVTNMAIVVAHLVGCAFSTIIRNSANFAKRWVFFSRIDKIVLVFEGDGGLYLLLLMLNDYGKDSICV